MTGDELEVLALGDVGAPLEHHVLEQVREAGAPALFVARADVVGDGHRDGGGCAIDVHHDAQPVLERRLLHLERKGGWSRCSSAALAGFSAGAAAGFGGC